MIRIAFLDNLNKLGGAQIFLAEVIERLDATKFEIWVNLPSEKRLESRYSSLNCHRIPYRIPELRSKNSLHFIKFVKVSWQICKFLKKKRIQLVHAHSLPGQIVGRIAKKFYGIKLVWRIQDPFGNDILYRNVTKNTDRILAAAPFLKVHIQKNYRVSSDKVSVAGDFIDFDYIDKAMLSKDKANIPFDAKSVKIGIFARLVVWKGQEEFIRVAHCILSSGRKCEFYLIGDGSHSYVSKLKDLASELGIDGRIHFIGYLDLPDALSVMAKMDIIVNCSIAPETCPRTVIEGAALYKPIVATKLGGTPEMVIDNLNGYLVDPGEIQTFAEKLMKLIDDLGLRIEMGKEGRKIIELKYSPMIIMKQFETVYTEVIGDINMHN